MKLFYSVMFLLLAMQDSASASNSTSTSSRHDLTAKKQLMNFYRTEFNQLAGEICLQLKDITEQLLNHLKAKNSTNKSMQEFQTNLTYFQYFYPFYVRFDLNESLAMTFSYMVSDYYKPGSNDVIKQLLQEFKYDDLRQQYKTVLKDFYVQKFQPKFEELKQNISNESQLKEFEKSFSKCIAQSQACEEFECLLSNFRENALKLKDTCLGNIQRAILNINLKYLTGKSLFYQCASNHLKFSKLTTAMKEKMTQLEKDFGKGFPIIKNLSSLFTFGDPEELGTFLLNYQIDEPLEQGQLLQDIFDDCQYRKCSAEYRNDLRDYVQYGFIDDIEHFRASVQQEGAAVSEDLQLIDMFENLSRYSLRRQNANVLLSLKLEDPKQLKKWRL